MQLPNNAPPPIVARTDPAVLRVASADVSLGSRHILHGINLEVRRGEIVVLLGPNGAGKSTLSRLISGQLAPAGGKVRVCGANPARSRMARRAIGLVPQQIALYERLTPRENLIAFGSIMGTRRKHLREKVHLLLKRVGLEERIDDPVRDLSGGMRRRINIAASLMHDPKLLVLDEPTVGLDVRAQTGIADLLRSLRSEGAAILLVTHDLAEAELIADRLAIMVQGRIRISGRLDELIDRVFQDQREILIEKPKGTANNIPTGLLERFGMRPGEFDGEWRGVLGKSDLRLASLFHTMSTSELEADLLTVRRAGLASLLAICIADAERH